MPEPTIEDALRAWLVNHAVLQNYRNEQGQIGAVRFALDHSAACETCGTDPAVALEFDYRPITTWHHDHHELGDERTMRLQIEHITPAQFITQVSAILDGLKAASRPPTHRAN